MALFQKSVTKKYLKNLDNQKVSKAYIYFQNFYGDKERLKNIMQLKEENYQEGFLREIFVQTLGYTLNPDKNYDLTTEFKNLKDSRKADGAILKDGKAIGVIELKSTKTKDLESIKEQAFGYKNNQPNCKYVITSNFQSIRFYIDNAIEYEEFNLFDLSEDQFKLFYLILSKESILNHLPDKLKQETKFHDTEITKKLYKDYQTFKNRIFDYLVSGNPNYDKLTLFKKSQKLLDRFLFILFAEDSGLIPPNAIKKITEDWQNLTKLKIKTTLYERYQLFFSHLNTGEFYEDWGEIPAYNGGLFRYDEILDNPKLVLPDGLLQNNLPVLSAYDFSSEVDVNILGHIFEHSLNEIEEIERELTFPKLETLEKFTSKRKKDGIFYTPKYITRYIVENTVGTLCNQKKTDLQIKNLLIEDSFYQKNGKLNQKGKNLFEILQTYKNWLLSLKILDPACGSGAFLNTTLDFLIAEHKEIDNIISELTNDKIRMFDTDKQILENNIYGVDINEESVEISKLSLWLRTAQRGRILSDLSGDIKCGNSLIDDPEVAGEKAFNWNVEFKEIMDNGGFDVVIGNPPYVPIKQQLLNNRNFIKKTYQYSAGADLYVCFIEKSINLIKKEGYLSIICPNKFFGANYGKKIRLFIKNNLNLIKIWDLKDEKVFADALISTVVIVIKNELKKDNLVSIKQNKNYSIIPLFDSNNKIQIEQDYATSLIIKKLDKNSKLSEFATIRTGIMGFEYWKMKDIISSNTNEGYKLYTNGNIQRYTDLWSFSEIDLYKTKYIKPFLNKNKNYINSNTLELFSTYPKILVRGVANQISAIIDFEGAALLVAVHSIIPKADLNEYVILALLNSKLINWYHLKCFYSIRIPQGSLKYPISFFEKIPVPNINDAYKNAFKDKVNFILSKNSTIQLEKERFINRVNSNFDIMKISSKLHNFHEFNFKTFILELQKQKITINLKKQDEWQEYFESYKQKVNELQNKINQTDKEIDRMVYDLYELTAEEIEIVENATSK